MAISLLKLYWFSNLHDLQAIFTSLTRVRAIRREVVAKVNLGRTLIKAKLKCEGVDTVNTVDFIELFLRRIDTLATALRFVRPLGDKLHL